MVEADFVILVDDILNIIQIVKIANADNKFFERNSNAIPLFNNEDMVCVGETKRRPR